MVIKILGPGCAKCERLFDEAEKAVAEAGVAAQIVKVTRLDEMMTYGLIVTPALVIDEQVVSSGKVLRAPAIAALIAQHQSGS